ncbi:T7SS effector LXG polymorphic toxin [Rummeliibacillus sp. SL167]|uniref:T7SS effector LXG polymorphic toxin n=1 Tax=Rummeliibacillus sp. SL167 TaxID=2579792 RepID=UPI0011B62973|nr:T7SS effector LXG polymorphic toxin [Rummeliibacillus sp. SL167]
MAGLQNGIEKTLKSLKNKQTEMAAIEKAVQGILALEDAFKGESGEAIRAYYQEVHLLFISYYQAFIADYESQLKAMDHELQKLESAENGRIDEAFLTEDLKTSLQNTANRTITLTDEANQTILSIQDIVATPSLNDASFLEEVTDAQKQIQSTVEKVHQFDYNQSKAFEELSNDVSNMQNYIDGIQAQMKSGKLQLENYTSGTLSQYQLDSWLKDEVGSTCSRVETEKVDRIEELQKKLAKASTPEEYLKIAKEIGIENLDDDQKQIVTMLETAEGISKGLLKAGKDFVKGIFDFATHPVKTIERTMDAIAHPIETYDYLSKSIADSFERDVINGDAKSRAEWISYALGTIGLSAVGTKGLGAVSKTGMTTVKVTAKVGVHKVKGAAQKIPTLDLYPYAPQHQLAGVNAGIVPYNTVNSVRLRDQLISMAKVEARGSGTGTKGTGKETYQHLKDYKNNKFFTRSVEYNAGKDGTGFTYKVYQRGDINWDMVRTKGAKKGRGLTNAEASAKYGLAPILDEAGSVATLHHSQQKGVGPLYEASTRYHNIANAKRAPLHPYKGKLNPFYPMDETTRGAFQKVDSINYWKIRGEEALGGR